MADCFRCGKLLRTGFQQNNDRLLIGKTIERIHRGHDDEPDDGPLIEFTDGSVLVIHAKGAGLIYVEPPEWWSKLHNKGER